MTRAPAATARRRPRSAAGGGTRRRQGGLPLTGLLPLGVLLALWQITAPARSPYFPPPSTWASALVALFRDGALVPAVAATLGTVVVALASATLLGAALGIVVGASLRADRALQPTLEFVRAIPPAALVPVATLLLGYRETMKAVVVTLAAVWPVLLNTRAGVQGLDQTLLDAARSLQLGRVDRVRKVLVPALLPRVLLGVRVAAPIAVVITLLVEILTQLEGVGALIARAQQTFQPPRVYGLIVVAGLLSLVVGSAVGGLEALASRHRPPR